MSQILIIFPSHPIITEHWAAEALWNARLEYILAHNLHNPIGELRIDYKNNTEQWTYRVHFESQAVWTNHMVYKYYSNRLL